MGFGSLEIRQRDTTDLKFQVCSPKGPADNIDIKPGDVIIALDGHYLYTIDDLRAILRGHEQGGRLAIRYRRDRLTFENYLALAARDAASRR